MRRAVTMLCVIAGTLATASTLESQMVTSSATGVRAGRNADSAWYERDTTRMVLQTRGDTLTLSMYFNDRLRARTVFLVHGDSARQLAGADSTGVLKPPSTSAKAIPVSFARSVTRMVDGAFKMAEVDEGLAEIQAHLAEARAAGEDVPDSMFTTEPDSSPATLTTYTISAHRSIEAHRDTLRYIRQCPGSAADTTVYLHAPGDSLRRLSPAPRIFGPLMTLAARADIGFALTKSRIPSPDAAEIESVQALIDGCQKPK